MSAIVFISSLDSAEQQQWLGMLTKLLPDESILLPEAFSAELAAEVDIAIVANPDPSILSNFPNLLWVQSLWAGVEALVPSIRQHNRQLEQSKQLQLVRLLDPQMAATMAEAVLAWTLYLHRNMPQYAIQQRQQLWQQLPCARAEETRVTVLGAGELGIAAINALLQQNYKVSCWSRSQKNIAGVHNYVSVEQLPEAIAQADILINLLPLTAETKGLLNQQLLSNLPRGAKLINFSRGAVLDHPALLELLDSGQLSHAVLDVFEMEPLPVDNPLWQHSQITVLPHISAPTNMQSAARVVADNINSYRAVDVLPTTVNLAQGY
ncbi:MAG: D-isomer specific 2-hydroxyacid dehydrogenase [Osedax symbiont Rs2]|nr:MAG: D-isomer specific 2-hydroxyacid dehydrogenase [Osedax symbiont Rs2]